MSISTESLEKILIDRWAYQKSQVGRVVSKLQGMDEALFVAFEKYLETDSYPSQPSYFGLSSVEISENYTFKPPAVFLCLDWIRRDPQNALDALVEEYKKPLPTSFNPHLLYEYLENVGKNKQSESKNDD